MRAAHNQAAPFAPLFSVPTLQSACLRKPVRTAMAAGSQASQQIETAPGHRCRIAEPLPEKPKGMWVRTYGCLLNEILQAEIRANEAQANRFQRLMTQVDNDLR